MEPSGGRAAGLAQEPPPLAPRPGRSPQSLRPKGLLGKVGIPRSHARFGTETATPSEVPQGSPHFLETGAPENECPSAREYVQGKGKKENNYKSPKE